MHLIFFRLFRMKRLRFTLFVLTIALSVGLFLGASNGTLIAKEQYLQSFSQSLGYIDYVVKSNETWIFNESEVYGLISNISDVMATSSRIQIWSRVSLNRSFFQSTYVYVVGVNWSQDAFFGDFKLINGSISPLETLDNECVVSKLFSNLINLQINDTLYLKTWVGGRWTQFNLTVKGIVGILSKVYDFDTKNPSNYWQINRAIFVNKEVLEKLFGNKMATHLYIHVTDPFNTAIFSDLKLALDGNFSICNIKERFISSLNEIINRVVTVVNLIYSMGFVVSFFVIVNIIYQSFTEWRYYIGLLKAIGYSNKGLLLDFSLSILVVSLLGCILAFPIALLSLNLGLFMVSILSGFALTHGISFYMSLELIYMSTAFGISSSLFFSVVPAVLFLRSSPLELMKHQYYLFYGSRKIWFFIVAFLGIILSIVGISNFLDIVTVAVDTMELEHLLPSFLIALVGMTFLISPIVILGTPLFAIVFIFSKKIRLLSPRNLLRNKGRTFFSVLIISFTVAFLLSGQIAYDSFTMAMRTQVYFATGSDIVIHANLPANVINDLKNIPNVSGVAGIRKLWWQHLNYSDTSWNRICFYAINSSQILNVLYTIQFKETLNNMDIKQTIDYLLEHNNTIILQDYLLKNLSVSIGENVTWVTPKGPVNLTVIGTISLMAGAWETIWMDFSIPNGYFMSLISYNIVQSIYPYRINNYSVFTSVFIKVSEHTSTSQVKKDILEVLRSHSIIPDSIIVAEERVNDNMRYYRSFYFILQVLFLAFVIISSLTLTTSVIYILHERRYEIGVLRSIGFTKLNVLGIILSEIFLIVIEGVIAGVVTGYLLSKFAISSLPFTPALPLSFVFTIQPVIYITLYVIITMIVVSAFFLNQISTLSQKTNI